jgi:hypothetical protein
MPHHLRHSTKIKVEPELEAKLADLSIKLCDELGVDFDAVDLGMKDGEIYAVNYLNPAPASDRVLLKEEIFTRLVKATANYLAQATMGKGKFNKFGKLMGQVATAT